MSGLFGDPSTATAVAADRSRAQPNSGALGQYTGAPPPTRLLTAAVPPAGTQAAVCIVPATRENRFVTLTAPLVAFAIYIGATEAASASNGIALTPGIPYEVSLPGYQAIFAASNAPVYLEVGVQIAGALAGDLERNLARR
jgi:hypothetical protein